ncbi:MAG: hypothetical protein O7D91_16355, partial [Planctomycetota bacterium]|nr:hypothetical protein [Planctomycetota bacterium]
MEFRQNPGPTQAKEDPNRQRPKRFEPILWEPGLHPIGEHKDTKKHDEDYHSEHDAITRPSPETYLKGDSSVALAPQPHLIQPHVNRC